MKYIETEKNAVRSGRRKFIAMASTYSLGVFNDNFFKQAVLLIAVTSGFTDMQGYATVLFAMPFILFSAYAGWIADRFAKRKVVVASKGLEVAAMTIGAFGLLSGDWNCILAMVFLMGTQSAFFSPALNGSIPELYPTDYVPKANAVLKLVTTLAILAGIALAGVALDLKIPGMKFIPSGYGIVATGVVVIAIIGFILSFGVYSKQASSSVDSFPWSGPLHSIHIVREVCRDKSLALALIADCFFYFVASIAVLIINSFGITVLGLSKSMTSLMSISLMGGICIGAFVVAAKMAMDRWSKYLVNSSFGMAIGLLLAASSSIAPAGVQGAAFSGALVITGIFGGLFLIPVTSFLQVRPSAQEKGKVLASANFCGFCAILISGGVFTVMNALFEPTGALLFLSAVTGAGSFSLKLIKTLGGKNGRPLFGLVLRVLLRLRYRIHLSGLNTLDLSSDKGVVFLPNHPALIDPVIVMSQLYRRYRPRPLSDEDQVSKPVIKQLMSLVKPIMLPSPKDNGRRDGKHVRKALEKVINCLKKNEQIILYPSGRLYRSKSESLAANSAVETLIKNVPEVQIVLVRTSGLWGSSFSWADGTAPSLFKNVTLYAKAILSAGLFFMPKRNITVELVRDCVVSSLSGRKTINAHLENSYNKQCPPNTHVPYYWWKGRASEELPEPVVKRQVMHEITVSSTVKDQVEKRLSELVGQKVTEKDNLANDLGMDSLMIMDIINWLESEFGFSIENSESLVTVADCYRAAAGKLAAVDNDIHEQQLQVPSSWFYSEKRNLTFARGKSIPSCFLEQLAKHPGRVVFCDRIAGAKRYRDIATAIFLLKPVLEKYQGSKIGIMLPPSVSASLAYLSVLFAGKIPVMFNWTSGIGNMQHGAEITGTQVIITAKKVSDKIEEQQGVDLGKVPIEWVYLDEIVSKISFLEKFSAVLKSRLAWRTLSKADIPATAAILFTSGSETKPKAVPLTHTNILCNMKDFATVKRFHGDDKLLGMLPPFHSLGLVGTIILPLCTGLKTVYHVNPTESMQLVRLIKSYGVTLTIGTPTFISGILQSGSRKSLKSLELIFTGAEKCPANVYDRLQKMLPETVLCEGYGITECSPLVSINSPENPERETIGRILPSLEYRIVSSEKNSDVDRGTKGILLLRGDSIFEGYYGDEQGRGFCDYQGKLWYDTGDYVRENPNGNLVFCGRKKRFVKLGGEMVSLPAIESILLDAYPSTPGHGTVLAVDAVETENQPEIILYTPRKFDRDTVNTTLKKAGLSPLHYVRRIIEVEEIPVLGSGKTDYRSLAKAARKGSVSGR